MKKIVVFFVAIVIVNTSQAQFKINYGELRTPPAKGEFENGVWYKLSQGKVYTFKKNAVGVMKAMTMINKILQENDLDYENYASDESLISSMVKDMNDYENLHFTISIGSSNIERIWRKGSEGLEILLSEDNYAILVIKLK
jgi:hypothetical protein